jgi:hypothetical protein
VYVRWKTARRRPKWAAPGVPITMPGKTTILGDEGVVTHSVQLVESYRNADGRPRQRVLLHLGTIAEYAVDDPTAQAMFWDAATHQLQVSLSWLTKQQLEAVIHQLAILVPPPTPKMQARYRRWLQRQSERSEQDGQRDERCAYFHWTPSGLRISSRPRQTSSA